MRLSLHPTPTTSPERLTPPGRWLGRSLTAGAVLAASLAVTACGNSDSSSSKSPTILNTEKVERAIEQSSLNQRGRTVHVSCPAGVHQKAGLVFSCTAFHKRGRTQFVVTQRDGAGRVRYQAR